MSSYKRGYNGLNGSFYPSLLSAGHSKLSWHRQLELHTGVQRGWHRNITTGTLYFVAPGNNFAWQAPRSHAHLHCPSVFHSLSYTTCNLLIQKVLAQFCHFQLMHSQLIGTFNTNLHFVDALYCPTLSHFPCCLGSNWGIHVWELTKHWLF